MGNGTKLVAALAAVMGVMIVVGTALLGVLILRRIGHGGLPAGTLTLAEPAGTKLLGVASAGHSLALALSGGGRPDRLVLLDPDTLRAQATLMLGR